jgi:hypothetical protein
MQDNTQIQVRSKFWATSPIRVVTYINGGIQVDKEFFTWDYFFAVNVLVENN